MTQTTRRRVPRRTFEASVGVLHAGKYFIGKSLQVGEGGMSLISDFLKPGDRVVITFQIPEGSLVCVRGLIRYLEGADAMSVGIQFENLEFHFKRELRNFVARATQDSIFA